MNPQVIGYYCLVAGACMIAGWWVAFRNRPYLLLLGIFFASLAASLIIGDRLQTGAMGAAWKWGLRGSLVVALISLTAAVVAAVQESRRRLQEVREHYRAATEALLEITRAKEQQLRQAQQQKTQDAAQDTLPGDEQP